MACSALPPPVEMSPSKPGSSGITTYTRKRLFSLKGQVGENISLQLVPPGLTFSVLTGLVSVRGHWRSCKGAGSQHPTQGARSTLVFRCQKHRQVSGTPEGCWWVLAAGLHPQRPRGGRQVASRARRALTQPPGLRPNNTRGILLHFPSTSPQLGVPQAGLRSVVLLGLGEAAFPTQTAVGPRLSAAFPTKLLVCLSPGFVREIKDPPIKKKKEEAQKRTLLIASLQNI